MIFEIAGSTNGALIGRFDSKNETKSSIMNIGSDPTTNQPHVYSVGAIASLAVQLKTVAPTLKRFPMENSTLNTQPQK